MRSNAPSNAIARCASPANASSTPIAASASTPSSRPFMGGFRYRADHPHEEPAVTLGTFRTQPDATAVRLEAAGGARRLHPHLDPSPLTAIALPHFTHWRCFGRNRSSVG